ncbi:hypothetical protein GCM10017788_65020 [Amycolatopsis acidiphila]|uniref:Hsp20/alpha crystallin family protein n=1 Tax=Amycolatopsis acidiphila TaxID=715473 RepID=A0A558ADT6_9PSEU|nr:Hsp20/alpha crystallin family protein [Amycolatopsis acidiphila]GHG89916.1 hypothetical protein GCM10017788_65020 [Amycolatopsis acidiphila]
MTLPVRRSSGPVNRWAPLREFEDLYEQMGQLVQSVSGAPAGAAWMPAADVTENDDEYVIEIELPGVHGDDIAVEANGRELVVSGEIKEKERKGILRRRTRRIGSFEFRTTLPGEIDVEHIDAKLSNGILTVHVPKNERSKRHKVKIVEG